MVVPVRGKVFPLTKPLRANAAKSIKLILKLITHNRNLTERSSVNFLCAQTNYNMCGSVEQAHRGTHTLQLVLLCDLNENSTLSSLSTTYKMHGMA